MYYSRNFNIKNDCLQSRNETIQFNTISKFVPIKLINFYCWTSLEDFTISCVNVYLAIFELLVQACFYPRN